MPALVPVPGIWHNGGRSGVKEAALKPLFNLFWQICCFRRGPQDVPYHRALLGLLLVMVLSIGLLSIFLLAGVDQSGREVPLPQQVLALLFSLVTWMTLVYGLLHFKNHRARYVQTMTAALGADLVLSVPQILLLVVALASPVESALTGLAQMTLLALYIWDMLVKGAIYASALGLGRVQGNLLSLALSFGLYMASALLFSPPPP